MIYAMFVVVLTLNGLTTPAVTQVGAFGSLAACETERAAFLTRLATPQPSPAGPQFAHSVSCIKISDNEAPLPTPAPAPAPAPAPTPIPAAPPVVLPLKGSIVTAQGAWTLGAAEAAVSGRSKVLLNGMHSGGRYALAMTQVAGAVYHMAVPGLWQKWSGTAWVDSAAPVAAGWRWTGTGWVAVP